MRAMNATVPDRLASLRDAMQRHGATACLVPGADPHLSEYLPPHWQAREWLSGFTGSAGTLVVTADFAGLWTDSRYFEQADEQLAGSGIELMRLRVPHAPEYLDWLQDALGEGQVLAVAGDSLAEAARRRLRTLLEPAGARLRTDLDLPGAIWTDRPALPAAPIRAQPEAFVDAPRAACLQRVREAMQHAGASHHLLSSLDDIAWITRLRGADVAYNPVFLAHLLVAPRDATLFVDEAKLDPALRERLRADGVGIAGYAALRGTLAALPAGARVLLDPTRTVADVVDALPADAARIERANPSTAMKAIKSPAELEHVRATMRADGVALVRAFARVERALAGGDTLTELDIDTILLEERARHPEFVGESFATIAGYMAHGALPHYRATPERHATLQADGLLLVDSGGQYHGGTTDVTRVWAFGATTAEQRRDATRVLQGLIALSAARFPEGASGPQLDALARAPIWADGADYGHGTGHGVGYFLNVHEGPHGIRPPAPGGALVPLQPGMITSIEPGLYKTGRHGIRHENLAAVVEAAQTEFGTFLAFETLTLCPIDTRALEPSLLSPSELAWLNAYHARVRDVLLPVLDNASDRDWLRMRCAPVPAGRAEPSCT